jgi:uncharacterized protein (TIGR00661 family)
MQQALAKRNIEVDYVFSGRAPDKLFDMAQFDDYQVFRGLTFATEAGKINYTKTLFQANLSTLWRDIKQLSLQQYDLVITDFEPVTAWAARRAGLPCIGLGHQYAFQYPVPTAEANWLASMVMRWFAPASIALGAHWHHFNAPILPPLIQVATPQRPVQSEHVLVYLPFEDPNKVLQLLTPLKDYQFQFFTDGLKAGDYRHIQVHPFGRESFQQQLQSVASVLCNAGFELASEALHLGKRILVKPVWGQMEQASNALALRQLGYGEACQQLSTERIAQWLATAPVVQVVYPDVAAAVADWLLADNWQQSETLCQSLWQQVQIKHPTY